MLHAPASEAQTESARERSRAAASPQFSIDIGIAPPFPGNQALLRMRASGTAAMPRPSRTTVLQRKCACGGSADVSGQCESCREKEAAPLQRRAGNGTTTPESVPPIVHDVLRSPGEPVDRETRGLMEPHFASDFSQVRVHTDSRAAQSARAVNALAYTVGRDIVFARGQHAPQTKDGQRLLAHELTHVVQQGGNTSPHATPLHIGPANDPSEREADRQAAAVMEARMSAPRASTRQGEPVVQRQPNGENSTQPAGAAPENSGGNLPDEFYPPDKAALERLRAYTCVAEPDPTKPKSRPFTAEEAIAVENALVSAKGTIASAISNFAQRNAYHLAVATTTFRKVVTFATVDAGFSAIQTGLNKLKTGSNLTCGTCDDSDCNPYPAFAVAYTQDDLSGVVACPSFFAKSALVQATTMLHEAGHVAALDPHFQPGQEHYCRPDPKIDCDDVCPKDDGNLIENVDAWAMLAYCVATVTRRDLDPAAGKQAAVDLRRAQDLASRAYGNLARKDPYHLTLAQRTFGDSVDFALLDGKVSAIKSALGAMNAETETTGATMGDAGCALDLIAYTPESGRQLVLCPGYFGASGTARPLTFLMHAGYKAGIAPPKEPGTEACPSESSFDCGHPCPEALDENDVGAWARFVSCIGMSG